MRYGSSIMTSHYDDYRSHETEACVVLLRDNELIVEYKREKKPRTYKSNPVNYHSHLSHWPKVDAFNGSAALTSPKMD